MATKASRPGRTLIVFGMVIAVLFGAVALGGSWKPKLGLDLQGGTRITLEASTETGDAVTPEKLEEAAGIIDSRVNGSGVSEAEVATQGDRNIIVEIPGQNRKDLVDTVKQTARRFRLVAAAAPGVPAPQPSTGPSGAPSPSASGGAAPSAEPSGKATPESVRVRLAARPCAVRRAAERRQDGSGRIAVARGRPPVPGPPRSRCPASRSRARRPPRRARPSTSPWPG